MKSLLIIIAFLIPFLGIGQNVGINTQSMPAPAASNTNLDLSGYSAMEMRTTFMASSLSQQQINTFQERSIQKLKDFYNYLSIISNPKFNKRLRENSKNQAKQLFYGTDCKVDGKLATTYIDSCFSLAGGVEWKATDIIVKKDMSPDVSDTSAGMYHGELSFKVVVNSIESGTKVAQIILSKSEKMFGETKREVWSVFICSIE